MKQYLAKPVLSYSRRAQSNHGSKWGKKIISHRFNYITLSDNPPPNISWSADVRKVTLKKPPLYLF